jgi:hypothetical protein
MSITTASKADRRRIADAFKERKVPRGIFAIACAATGQKWVNSSRNLSAAQNSLWFQLRLGNYRNAALQQAWNLHGEAAFSLEVLEEFDLGMADLLLNDLYTAKKREWAASLGAPLL